MKHFNSMLIAMIFLCFCCFPTLAQKYSKSVDLPPLKMSYDDLKVLLEKTIAFTANANQDTTNLSNAYIHKLEITGPDITVSKTKEMIGFDYNIFPKEAYSLNYTFESSNTPITTVYIYFTDYSRRINVEGTKPEQVEALFALLQSSLSDHSILLGGVMFRYFAYFIVWGFFSIISFLPNLVKSIKINPIVVIASSLASILFVISVLILPYDKYFPGFAIYSGEVSFIRRYTAELSLFIGLIPIISSSILYLINKNRKPKKKK